MAVFPFIFTQCRKREGGGEGKGRDGKRKREKERKGVKEGGRERERCRFSCVFLIRTLMPSFTRVPSSWPNDLPKAPLPNVIKHSVHSKYLLLQTGNKFLGDSLFLPYAL